MVRPMKCPHCGNTVNVSSHWKDTICPNCKNVFEIGVEVFELSEEDQKKEQERALANIKKKEEEAAMRKAETAKRLRQVFKIPEPDPHKHIVFEDEEETSKKSEVPDSKKRMIIIGAGASAFVLILAVVIFLASVISKKATIDTTAVTTTETTTTAGTSTSEDVNTTENQMYDSGWNDGYAIDSNSEDGRFKIDLQGSDSGEQKDAKVKPDVVSEADAPKKTDSVSDNTVTATPSETIGDSSDTTANGLNSSAVGKDETGTTPGATSSPEDNKAINDLILNGAK